MGLLGDRLVLVPLTFFCVLRRMFVSKSVQQGYSKPRPFSHKMAGGQTSFSEQFGLRPAHVAKRRSPEGCRLKLRFTNLCLVLPLSCLYCYYPDPSMYARGVECMLYEDQFQNHKPFTPTPNPQGLNLSHSHGMLCGF